MGRKVEPKNVNSDTKLSYDFGNIFDIFSLELRIFNVKRVLFSLPYIGEH